MDPSHSDPVVHRPISRRDLATTALTGAVATVAASMLPSESAHAQSPVTQPATTPAIESRLAAFERTRGTPLTDAQRARMPGELRSIDAAGAALRRYPLSDGVSEPAFVFTPVQRVAFFP